MKILPTKPMYLSTQIFTQSMRYLNWAIALSAVSLGMLVGVNNAQAATDYLSTSAGQVGTVDTATGVFTPITNSAPTFTDIALSSSNQLFGNTFSQLYSINTTTGASSPIGNLAVGDLNALGFSNSNVLYGAGIDGSFYTINTSSGVASLVAKIPGFASSGDIAYNPSTNTFLATSATGTATGTGDELFSITPTGTATDIGKIGFGSVYGLVINNGTLFGYTANNQQLIINPTTGAGTLDRTVTGVSGQIFGGANAPSQGTTSVPEPSEVLGILALGGIGLASRFQLRSRQVVLQKLKMVR